MVTVKAVMARNGCGDRELRAEEKGGQERRWKYK